MKPNKASMLTNSAMIAAIYFALGVAFAPISFGPVQFRVAELLTILPIFTPAGVWGVTVGCIMSNLYGVAAGASILGPIDVILGSTATLLAALMTMHLGKVRFKGLPILATLPPVIINAVVIGGELTYAMTGGFDPRVFAINAFQVGLGQVGTCVFLGLAVIYALEKTGVEKKIFPTF